MANFFRRAAESTTTARAGTSAGAIVVDQLRVSYAGVPALENLSVEIPGGTLVGVIGPNGAGKSTFFKAMLDLIPTDSGSVRFDGRPFQRLRTDVAYVPQRTDIDWDFPISVLDTVLLGTYPRLGAIRRPGPKERRRAAHCLEYVGLAGEAKKPIGTLSGGQQQRVFLARALAQDAIYFLFDEPFAGIDQASEQSILSILGSLRDAGKTVLAVHHDMATVASYFDYLVVIDRTLVASGTVNSVLDGGALDRTFRVSRLP